jgi:SOS response regulatory protein OraA/RecX
MPIVTALREVRGKVAVELDGAPWRTLAPEAVLETRLAVGRELDRSCARALARALRRQRAESVALRALARHDRSRASLDARLAGAGVAAAERQHVLGRAERSGLVDDARFAATRAHQLAERGFGDLLVLADLERQGVDEHVARDAVVALDPEADRAARIIARRGATPQTLRYLASRGFGEEALEAFVADIESGALG